MFEIKSSKKQEQVLPQATIDKIPHLNDDPDYAEACEKVKEFEELLKVTKERFFKIDNYTAVPPTAKTDPLKDAQLLLAGTRLDALSNVANVTCEKSNLRRQWLALEQALNILTEARDKAFYSAIQKICDNMPPEVGFIYFAILQAARDLESAIRRAIITDGILDGKGLSDSHRGRFVVHDFWKILLANRIGIGTLPGTIENQLKNWEEMES